MLQYFAGFFLLSGVDKTCRQFDVGHFYCVEPASVLFVEIDAGRGGVAVSELLHDGLVGNSIVHALIGYRYQLIRHAPAAGVFTETEAIDLRSGGKTDRTLP